MIAFFFIFWHVFQTRGWIQSPWWVEHVTRPLGGGIFDPKHAAISSAEAVRSSTIATAFIQLAAVCIGGISGVAIQGALSSKSETLTQPVETIVTPDVTTDKPDVV